MPTSVEQQGILEKFVMLHGKRVSKTSERRLQLARYRDTGMALNCPIEPYSQDEIVAEFDCEDARTRWSLQQLNAYDVDKEYVLGIIFDDIVVCHVIRIGDEIDEDD